MRFRYGLFNRSARGEQQLDGYVLPNTDRGWVRKW
jgi:hypothetical protein